MKQTIDDIASNNSSTVACAFVAIGPCFSSHYLAKIGGYRHRESRLTVEEVLEAKFSLQSNLKSHNMVSSELQCTETHELESRCPAIAISVVLL
jgi:hypothetical protein